MLLRRITEHVKAQNWTAVGIDFVIVVVGVFIGIQVANWNDDRAVRQDQRAMLEQLYADLAPRMEGWLEANNRVAIEDDANERVVLDALMSGTLNEEDKARFDAGLLSLVQWYGVDVSLLQRRMETTELFSEFQGTAYEDILIDLHRNWTRTDHLTTEFEKRGHNARDIIYSRVFMEPGPFDPPERGEITPVYVFEELVQDKEFRHAVAQLYEYNNRVRTQGYQAVLGVADTVSRLEAALYPNGNVP